MGYEIGERKSEKPAGIRGLAGGRKLSPGEAFAFLPEHRATATSPLCINSQAVKVIFTFTAEPHDETIVSDYRLQGCLPG
jgi:hypothetical protein